MIVVFWLELNHMNEWQHWEPMHKSFAPKQLSEALKFAEDLRKQRVAAEATIKQHGEYTATRISHVCLQSEMPEAVGQAGVSDPDKDYSWSKRRIDPSIPLGRPKSGTDEQVVDFSEE
jgi:hypothetical protein